MAVEIRALGSDDATLYRELRLQALRDHPEAFATSYEEELARNEAQVTRSLAPGAEQVTFGAFDGDRLVGISTLVRSAKIKLRHRATIAAMYVVQDARASGAGRALLQAALLEARRWGVGEVSLAVTVGNTPARSLYLSAGFEPYGVEPRSIRVGDRFHDVEWMNLQLR